ncbi:hypothetical protein [Leisingera thetidis]|uniref:hypothetical protein n=1 Tax=Leisingera thetidis TaxID=2930199 RepID=UPI0021F6B270|nr:hypothetical protein [Leisingera thetidis]
MSDPVTHAEIEDVLSSIRRLVSDDNRGESAAPEPAARLVLTPALRVQAPESRDSYPPADDAPAGDAPQAGGAGRATPVPGEAEQAAPAEPGGAAADAPAAEDAGPADSFAILAEEPPIAFRHRSSLPPAGPAQDGGPADAVPEAAQAGTDPAGSDTAEPEVAAAEAPWGDPDATLFAAAAEAKQPGDGPDWGSPAKDYVSGTAGSRAASVVRKIAELEARTSRSQDRVEQHWEPDSQTEAPFAASGADTIEWRDEPLPARRAASGGKTAGAEEADTASLAEAAIAGAALETLADSGDSYLDEDGLRDLVASIVREELQGPLGERITRNVRKLVRREIQRALAAHDLL